MAASFLRSRGTPDRAVIAMSDIEMGAGGAVDDFLCSDWLGDRLRAYDRQFDGLHLDFVFNGDTFDLLKTSYRDAWPHHVTADIAVGKMERVADAHPAFFAALRDILARRGDRAAVHFVAGNHDLELLFPEVQAMIRFLTAPDERVRFHGHEVDIGRAHFEHGSQIDPLFRVDPGRPFLEHDGEVILNLSWTSVALLDIVIPLQEHLGHHDRLKPKRLVLELLPEVRELLLDLAWTYWTRDFWRQYFGSRSPLKRLSWTMIKEVVWRTVALDVDVAMDESVLRGMLETEDHELYVVGHQHEPAWWSFGDRKVLRTGCLRDELMISEGGRALTPINKTWAEILMAGDRVVRSHLVEEVAPPRPADAMPASIFDVLPWARSRLGSAEARLGSRDAQRDQEARERRGE